MIKEKIHLKTAFETQLCFSIDKRACKHLSVVSTPFNAYYSESDPFAHLIRV